MGPEKLTIVIVEDEPDINDLLSLYFRNDGWDVFTATDGDSGLATIRARQPDFVILDIGLPGSLNGLDICRELRQSSNVPLLFLTARDDEIDRILGLEMGADDYVPKPFSPREVVARVKAILRRGQVPARSGERVEIGDLIVDRKRHSAAVAGEEVALATQEFALLLALVDNQGQVLSRQQLLDSAWGPDWYGDPRTVDVHIRQLRKKLGDDIALHTVRGVGYRLG